MQPYLLGIDIGTGSTKAVAIHFNGVAINSAQYHYPVKNPQPGYSEQDPELILGAFYNCITDTIKKTGQNPYAISLSSAMHSLIPVNEYGNALSNMMTWADARSEQVAEKLRASEKAAALYRTSGTPIHAMAPLCKLVWLRENEPELFNRAHKFIGIKEYIWFHLFGEFEIDYAIASATGLFDIKRLIWNEEACDIAGISADKLSNPANTTYKRNDVKVSLATSLQIDEHTVFVIGASDGCCANLGSFVSNPDTASLTIGTSGAVRITSPQPVFNNSAMIFNYLLNEKTFVCGGAINNGGIVFNWLLKSFTDKQLAEHADYDAVFKQIATIPAGSEGLIFLPYLYGERAPLWDTKTCGVFFNIKPQHTREHFLRAGLEGICFALNNVLQTVEESSTTINWLHISGGFITSATWTQILADITGKNLAIIQKEDASAIGAIFLAMQALGIVQHVPPEPEQIIIPNLLNHQNYKDSFLLFKKLYSDLKDTMHWLHDKI
jgi:gluconokinase